MKASRLLAAAALLAALALAAGQSPADQCPAPIVPAVFVDRPPVVCPNQPIMLKLKPGGVTLNSKLVCGAEVPDMSKLLGDGASYYNVQQWPQPGAVVLPAFNSANVTNPAWTGLPMSSTGDLTVDVNFTRAGVPAPDFRCSVRVKVEDAGPCLAGTVCPPPRLALALPPNQCSVNITDLTRNLTLPAGDCMRPVSVDPSRFDQRAFGSDGAPISSLGARGLAKVKIVHRDIAARLNPMPGAPGGGDAAPACVTDVTAYRDVAPVITAKPLQVPGGKIYAVKSNDTNLNTTLTFDVDTRNVGPDGPGCSEEVMDACRYAVATRDVLSDGTLPIPGNPRAFQADLPSRSVTLSTYVVPDSILDPGGCQADSLLRTYSVSLSCTFNKGKTLAFPEIKLRSSSVSWTVDVLCPAPPQNPPVTP